MERVEYVQTKNHQYPIFIGETALKHLSFYLIENSPSKICVITDDWLQIHHLHHVLREIPNNIETYIYTVPRGEAAKTIETYYKIMTFALEKGLDRKSLFIAFGGGSIGDVTGFSASTFMRGIKYIQVPTTLLAHDSSIGGKTGINHHLGKNLIGSFYQPDAIFYQLSFLSTLPKHELRSGFAEIIKAAMIHRNPFLESLQQQFSKFDDLKAENLLDPIMKAIETKKLFVEEDEFEQSVRAYLNFGHTLGHAIEHSLPNHQITHGEAVLIGMIFALRLSKKIYPSEFSLENFIHWVEHLEYEISIPKGIEIKTLIERMKKDKKAVEGKIHFVLLQKLGVPIKVKIDEKMIIETLEEM